MISKPLFRMTLCDYNKKVVSDLYDSTVQYVGGAQNVIDSKESNGWKTLQFTIPDNIDGEPNWRIQGLHGQMLIRTEDEDGIDWYIISKQSLKHEKFTHSYTANCQHISRLLKARGLNLTLQNQSGSGNGIGTAEQLLQRVLQNTGWSVGHVDTFYQKDGVTQKVRTITSNVGTGAWKNIQTICSTFACKPTFNGEDNTVDLAILNPFTETTSGTMDTLDDLIQLHYGNTLQGITKTEDTSNIVTALTLQGQYSNETGYTTINELPRRRYIYTVPDGVQLEGWYQFTLEGKTKYLLISSGGGKLDEFVLDQSRFSYQLKVSELIYDTFDNSTRLYVTDDNGFVYVLKDSVEPGTVTTKLQDWQLDQTVLARTNTLMNFDYFNSLGLLTDQMIKAIADYNINYPIASEEYLSAYQQLLNDRTILGTAKGNALGITQDDDYIITKAVEAQAPTDTILVNIQDDQHTHYHKNINYDYTNVWYPSVADPVYISRADGSVWKGYIAQVIQVTPQKAWEIKLGCTDGLIINPKTGLSYQRYCYQILPTQPVTIKANCFQSTPNATPILSQNDNIIILNNNIGGRIAAVETTIESCIQTLTNPANDIKAVYYQVQQPPVSPESWWFNPQLLELKYCTGAQWVQFEALQPTLTSDEYSLARQKYNTIRPVIIDMIRQAVGTYRHFEYTATTDMPQGYYAFQNLQRLYVLKAIKPIEAGDKLIYQAPQQYWTSNVWKAKQVNDDQQTQLQYSAARLDGDQWGSFVLGGTLQKNPSQVPASGNCYYVTEIPYNANGWKSAELTFNGTQYKIDFRARTVYGGYIHWNNNSCISTLNSDGSLVNKGFTVIDCKTSIKIPLVGGQAISATAILYEGARQAGASTTLTGDSNWLIVQDDSTVQKSGNMYGARQAVQLAANTLWDMHFVHQPSVIGAKNMMNDLFSALTDNMGWMFRQGTWNDSSYSEDQILAFYSDGLDNLKEVAWPKTTYSVTVPDLVCTDQCDDNIYGVPVAKWKRAKITDPVRVIDEDLHIDNFFYIQKITRNESNRGKDTFTITDEAKTFSGHSLADTLSRINEAVSDLQSRKSIYERASALGDSGRVAADILQGAINTNVQKIQSGDGTYYTDTKGNMVFEAADGLSAMTLNGNGFMIANGRKPDGSWNWRTFGTGEGFTADLITAGQLNAGRITIIGSDRFYWDADNIYILDQTDDQKQIRIGLYDGQHNGIGFTTDGGQTWQNAIGFESISLSALRQSSYLKIDQSGIDIKADGTFAVKSGGNVEIQSGGNLTIDADANLDITVGDQINVVSGGSINVVGGDVTIGSQGNVNIGSGSKLKIDAGADMDVNVSGAINITGEGQFNVDSGGDVTIKSGGTFNVQTGDGEGSFTSMIMDSGGFSLRTKAPDSEDDQYEDKFSVSASGVVINDDNDIAIANGRVWTTNNLIVSTQEPQTRPNGTKLQKDDIWIKPNTTGTLTGSYVANITSSLFGGTNGYYIPVKGVVLGDTSGSAISYTVSFPFAKHNDTVGYTQYVQVRLYNSTKTDYIPLGITQQIRTLGQGTLTYTATKSSNKWFCGGTAGQDLTLYVWFRVTEANYNTVKVPAGSTVKISATAATNVSNFGWNNCDIKWYAGPKTYSYNIPIHIRTISNTEPPETPIGSTSVLIQNGTYQMTLPSDTQWSLTDPGFTETNPYHWIATTDVVGQYGDVVQVGPTGDYGWNSPAFVSDYTPVSQNMTLVADGQYSSTSSRRAYNAVNIPFTGSYNQATGSSFDYSIDVYFQFSSKAKSGTNQIYTIYAYLGTGVGDRIIQLTTVQQTVQSGTTNRTITFTGSSNVWLGDAPIYLTFYYNTSQQATSKLLMRYGQTNRLSCHNNP